MEHNQDKVANFLKKTSKLNFVLPNGCVIVGTIDNNKMVLTMLENMPTDTTRFISSDEFNSLNLSAPIPQGSKNQDVYVFMRHGQARHNLTSTELEKVWEKMVDDEKEAIKSHAILRVGKSTWTLLPKERQDKLILQELCYDAPLTEKGKQEARDAARILGVYLQKYYPDASVQLYTSELQRAYETAAMVVSEWYNMHLSVSYDPVINAGYPVFNELHREIGSTVHMIGTPGRQVAEKFGLPWTDYAAHILKVPQTQEQINAMNDDDRFALEDKVINITSENLPIDRDDRRSSVHGVLVRHLDVKKEVYPDGIDLFSVLSTIYM
jgi:bisphosphoglycerate-dependent phosphoglycerate mutase